MHLKESLTPNLELSHIVNKMSKPKLLFESNRFSTFEPLTSRSALRQFTPFFIPLQSEEGDLTRIFQILKKRSLSIQTVSTQSTAQLLKSTDAFSPFFAKVFDSKLLFFAQNF